MKHQVEIFTDGACHGNPGKGGWGVLLRSQKKEETTLYGGEVATTNNRMELTAVIMALESLQKPCKIILTTDSKYVLIGITEWIHNWKKKDWKTASGKPVKNVDLWLRLDQACYPHDIDWKWVKGHNGHRENELVDALANRGANELSSSIL